MTANQLSGTATETMEVCNWIADDLPWLVGDATDPENLRDADGRRHTPGIYLDPKWGELVIRVPGKDSLRAAYGDWVIKHADGHWSVGKRINFDLLWVRVLP